jgi:hypothetical protein
MFADYILKSLRHLMVFLLVVQNSIQIMALPAEKNWSFTRHEMLWREGESRQSSLF